MLALQTQCIAIQKSTHSHTNAYKLRPLTAVLSVLEMISNVMGDKSSLTSNGHTEIRARDAAFIHIPVKLFG